MQLIPKDCPMFKTCGGVAGRIEDPDGVKRIGIRFKYWMNPVETSTSVDDDGNPVKVQVVSPVPIKVETPVFILDPWAARYAGWHLLRRGIIDGVKEASLNYRRRRRKHHAYHKTG